MAFFPAIPNPNSHQSSRLLVESLSKVLPAGHTCHAYHLTTPPTQTDALFSAPPDARPDRTYCESHFLALSIDIPPRVLTSATTASPRPRNQDSAPPKEVFVFALEILIFTTAYTSTFFVSKADSTGFLHLLNLPKGTPSPVREVTSAFIDYLVKQRKRKGIQSIVSLFARAQGQYLFPGSVEYSGKHVLTDRGLVKWWCKVLSPLVDSPSKTVLSRDLWHDIKGYLVVPGLDTYETRAFIPRTANNGSVSPNWVLSHPLERISHYTQEYDWVPPRCLIPRYPDDPKSRFRDELDAEADEGKGSHGAWKSVQNLEQFWELMAFRQECSAGGLTGFIWVVLDPSEPNEHRLSFQSNSHPQVMATPNALFDSSLPLPPTTELSTPSRSQSQSQSHSHVLALRTPQSSPLKSLRTPGATALTPPKSSAAKKRKHKKLTGHIMPREPRVKTSQRNYLVDRPVTTAYYYWPPEGRGRRLIKEDGYKRSIELLLRLDFANLELAAGSTKRWVDEVGLGAAWGLELFGSRKISAAATGAAAGAEGSEQGQGGMGVNNLSGLIKRKRPEGDGNGANGQKTSEAAGSRAPEVNVLGAGSLRKKTKEMDVVNSSKSNGSAQGHSGQQQVNILGGSLVRKKRKSEENAGLPSTIKTTTDMDLNRKPASPPEQPKINILGAGLVRKKPRAT